MRSDDLDPHGGLCGDARWWLLPLVGGVRGGTTRRKGCREAQRHDNPSECAVSGSAVREEMAVSVHEQHHALK